MSASISIIIPTFHRKESLLRLLGGLKSQVDTNMEVVVVEQGDDNGKEIQAYAKKYKIRLSYVFSKEPNTAKAKNLGAKKARGKFFVFYDDDVVVHKNNIRNLLKNFSDGSIGCVGGRVVTDGQKSEILHQYVGRVSPWSTFSDGYSSTIRQDIDTPIGCNMAFPRVVFEKAGGFDEQYTAAIREESDLALRIKAMGYLVVFDPTAVVTHKRETTGGGRKTEGRMAWYFHFLSNETYFFLKHMNHIFFPVFFFTRMHWIFRCMFGFGREVSPRSMVTPWRGIMDGIRKYKKYKRQILIPGISDGISKKIPGIKQL